MKNGKIVGTVKEVWRYPVKSMQGQKIPHSQIAKFGVIGDRGWAVKDDDVGEIRGVRKLPKLLNYSAAYVTEPSATMIPPVRITHPTGELSDVIDTEHQAAMSEYLKKPVSLWPLQPKSNVGHYRLAEMANSKDLRNQFGTDTNPDISSISLKLLLELSVFATPLGRYYDAYPLHLLTTASLVEMANCEPKGDFDARRFRPNIVIDSGDDQQGFVEFGWTGGVLAIGDTLIKCETRTVRCSMPAQPQPGLSKNAAVVKSLVANTDRHLGIYATVIREGRIKEGDDVVLYTPRLMKVKQALEPITNSIKRKLLDASLKAADYMSEKNSSNP
ncbi:hypothetical protein A9Q99_23495 [Gammaproteobacteria bacterium 45_16_T64]|nr:hypothetical protein A9Q99_23495 [Gammaproteobacteria bacterium 45_16_T64]